MATHTLVQYVKRYNHHKHDAEIKQHLFNVTAPQQVYKYFLKNKTMQQNTLTEARKVLNDGYRVPDTETDFKTFEFEPVPEGQEVHMDQDVFCGTAESF
jgi:hypothetical protein